MTREEFKRRWESDEAGGGITNEDIEQCAYAWKIAKKSDGYSRSQLIALVTAAAGTADADYWAKDLPEGTDVLDCADESGGDMIRKTARKENTMPSSQARQRAVGKYQRATYDDIKLRVPKGYRDTVLRAAADAEGVSLNEYILSSIAQKIAEEHPEIEGAEKWKVSLAKEK